MLLTQMSLLLQIYGFCSHLISGFSSIPLVSHMAALHVAPLLVCWHQPPLTMLTEPQQSLHLLGISCSFSHWQCGISYFLRLPSLHVIHNSCCSGARHYHLLSLVFAEMKEN
jgi:hypothetical protein